MDCGTQWDHGMLACSQCLDHRVLACRFWGMRGAVPAQCPWLPLTGMEDEECPDHQMLLCSLPASPTWYHSEGEVITLQDCQRNSWSSGKSPGGIVGPGLGQSWFISVLGSQFPTSLEMSSRFPPGAWFPWKDLHLAAGSREEWDFALHGSKLILGRAAGTSVPGGFLSSCTCWAGFHAERWQQVQAGAYLPRGRS